MDESDTSSEKADASGAAIVEEPFDPAESDPAAESGAAGVGDRSGEDGADSVEANEAPAEGEGPASGPKDEPAEPTLEEQLAEARAAGGRTREQMLRVAADFDNFRKRTARDLDGARRRARQGVVRDFLPVFDNLERATDHAGAAPDPVAFSEGIRIVLKQFDDTLRRLGIKRIEAVGAAFDPSLHESIQLVESTEHEVGTIVSMVQPGYKHGDELLRPALVAVSKGPPAAPPAEPALEPELGAADGAATVPNEPGDESEDEPPASTADGAVGDGSEDEAESDGGEGAGA